MGCVEVEMNSFLKQKRSSVSKTGGGGCPGGVVVFAWYLRAIGNMLSYSIMFA